MKKKIIQFGFRVHGNLCAEKNIPVVNCTTIPNPYKRNDGATDAERIRRVKTHPLFEELVQQALALLEKHDEIGVACQFGKHRSGAVVEEVEFRCKHEIEVVKP